MKRILNFLLVLISLGLVPVLAWPMMKWYWERPLLLGTDFYLTGSYLGYLLRHFSLPPFSWKYIWYAGQPLAFDYPNLLFYILLLPAAILGVPVAVKVGMIAGSVVFFCLFFLLLFRLSKNPLLSLGLVFLLIWSIGFYGSLIKGGSLPYYFSQLFLPLVFFPLIAFWREGEKRALVWAAFLTGFSMLVHPAVGIGYLVPASLIFIWLKPHLSLALSERISDGLVYLLVVFGIGFSAFLQGFKGVVDQLLALLGQAKPTVLETSGPGFNLAWEKLQFFKLAVKVNPLFFFLFFALGAVSLLFFPLWLREKKRKTNLALPLSLLILYTLGFLWAFVFRFNPFQGGWYRAYWALPVFLGLLVASFWQELAFWLRARLKREWQAALALGGVAVLVICLFVSLASRFGMFDKRNLDWIFTAKNLGKREVLVSSAFPDLVNSQISRGERERLKSQLVPSWLPADDKNWRLFDLDAEFNIWWNSIFDMPLVKGYVDPPYQERRTSYFFLQDIVLGKDEVEKNYGWSREMTKNAGLFFLDWSGIKYLEGGASEGRASIPAPSSFLEEEEIIEKKEEVIFKDSPYFSYFIDRLPEIDDIYEGTSYFESRDERLTFYKVKDELTTPIMRAANQPVIALIGKPEGLDLVYRVLAFLNLNSQKVVVVNGPEKIDQWGLDDYQQFEAVVLYLYDYKSRNRAFDILSDYVEKGGNLLIETGGDVKEAEAETLPAIFPIAATKRGELGREWQVVTGADSIFENVAVEDFSPLVIDSGGGWNLSWAQAADLKGEMVLKQQGKIVMAKKQLGKGMVYWSGINLPYHIVDNNNLAEARLLGNILEQFMDFEWKETDWELDWLSAQKRKLSFSNARGVLFKETYFPGWQASFDGGVFDKRLKVYLAGPIGPGYMYVFTPEPSGEVTFVFSGSWGGWLRTILPYLVIVVVIDYLVFQGRFLAKRLGRAAMRSKKKMGGWWEKEEED